jgi:hypothetical protein
VKKRKKLAKIAAKLQKIELFLDSLVRFYAETAKLREKGRKSLYRGLE